MHKAGIQRSKKDLIDLFVSMKESPWNFSMAILRFLRTFIVQTSFADSVPRLKCGRFFLSSTDAVGKEPACRYIHFPNHAVFGARAVPNPLIWIWE